MKAAVSVVVLAALWTAPIVDELSNEPGNMTEVYRYFRNPPTALHSIVDGLQVAFAQFSLWPPWLSGSQKLSGFELDAMHHTVIPITLPIIVVAAVVLWRKGPPAGRRYIMTLTLAWVTGVLSVARTSDTVYAYRLFWAWLLAMLSWLVVVWAIAVVLPAERRSALGPRVAAAALAVTVVLAGVNSVSALRADIPLRQESEHIEALLPALEEDLPSDRSSVLFRDHNWPTWWIGFGLKLGLEKSGSVTAATRAPWRSRSDAASSPETRCT